MSMPPDGPDRDSNYGAGPEYGSSGTASTNAPGICLIIVGLLSLVCGIFCFLVRPAIRDLPPEEFEEAIAQAKQMYPQFAAEPTPTVEALRSALDQRFAQTGSLWVGVSLLVVLGGMCMLARRVYWLSVLGSVLAVIPCISCTGCLGLGQGVGIWSLIVLMRPEVKALFR